MFKCQRFTKRNEEGQIVSSGLDWTEGRNWLLNLWIIAFFIPAGVGGLFLIAGVIVSSSGSMLVGAVALGLAYAIYKLDVPQRPRRLVFHRGGAIEAPLGFASTPRSYRRVKGTIAQIASIEAKQVVPNRNGLEERFSHVVVLYTRDGGACHVASRLDPYDAHKVAVQLTQALAALKEDMTDGTRKADGVAGKRSQALALID